MHRRVVASTVLLAAWAPAFAAGCGDENSTPARSAIFGGAAGSTNADAAGGSSGDGGSSSGAAGGGAGDSSAGAGGSSGIAGDGGGAAAGGTSAGGTSTGGAGGGAADGGGGTGADAGPGGAAGAGGTPAFCGNGMREGTEECDGTDLVSCVDLGFTAGTTTCTSCAVDSSGCTGTEICWDDEDNDGDGVNDCADSDCAAACATSCGAGVAVLSDPASVVGDTSGHAAVVEPGCFPTLPFDAGVSPSGPEIVYQFTASNTGVLDVRMSSTDNLNVSVRTICGDVSSEVACSDATFSSAALERVLVPISLNDSVFIVVDGTGASTEGGFSLDATTRPVACPDGFRDPGEPCDDGNTFDGDSCTNSCVLTANESESNDTSALADAYGNYPWIGAIDPAGDVDVYSFVVSNPSSVVEIEIKDLGNGECPQKLADSRVEIIGTNGTDVLAADDDGGDGLCSSAITIVGPGTYFVRVTAGSSTPTFPYALGVFVTP